MSDEVVSQLSTSRIPKSALDFEVFRSQYSEIKELSLSRAALRPFSVEESGGSSLGNVALEGGSTGGC